MGEIEYGYISVASYRSRDFKNMCCAYCRAVAKYWDYYSRQDAQWSMPTVKRGLIVCTTPSTIARRGDLPLGPCMLLHGLQCYVRCEQQDRHGHDGHFKESPTSTDPKQTAYLSTCTRVVAYIRTLDYRIVSYSSSASYVRLVVSCFEGNSVKVCTRIEATSTPRMPSATSS